MVHEVFTKFSQHSCKNMSAKVAAVSDEVQDFGADRKKAAAAMKNVIEPSIATFKAQLDEMCKTLSELKDKLSDKEAPEEKEEEETVWQRIMDNSLREMFIGKEVESEDVDNVVNTLTLMNALILTIPYGLMASAGYDYWDWVEATLASCQETKFTYQQNFTQFSNAFNAVVYSTISVLLMAMAYYLLRPKENKKFRKWWKYARYVILMMLFGTVTSCVSLIAVSTWLFSWYMIPTSKFCTYSAVSQFLVGVAVIVVSFSVAAFLML